MDIKDIAKKSFAGEDVSELIKDFTPEQKIELDRETHTIIKEAKDKELNELTALRKEKARVQALTDTATKDIQEKIRAEQIDKAKAKLVEEFKLKPEDTAKIDEAFKVVDSGKMDADLILVDMRKAFALANSDSLIKAQKDNEAFSRQAAEFNAGGAGSPGSGGGSGEGDKKYSTQAYDLVREAQKQGIALTLDEAERGLQYKPRTKF